MGTTYEKFTPNPQYRDVAFLILWVLHLFVVFAFLIYGGIAYAKDDNSNSKGGDDDNIIITSDNALPIFGVLGKNIPSPLLSIVGKSRILNTVPSFLLVSSILNKRSPSLSFIL